MLKPKHPLRHVKSHHIYKDSPDTAFQHQVFLLSPPIPIYASYDTYHCVPLNAAISALRQGQPHKKETRLDLIQEQVTW